MDHRSTKPIWVSILLPLPVEQAYDYSVPPECQSLVAFGKRVEVQFGQKKLYTGIIIEIHDTPSNQPLKPIREVLDQQPIFLPIHLKFWKWMAQYYHCFLGEVMNAALPAPLKIDSETLFTFNENHTQDENEWSDEVFLIGEAFQFQPELSWADIQSILQKNNINKPIAQLLASNVIYVKEKAKFKNEHREEWVLDWTETYRHNFSQALEDTQRSKKQTRALLALQQLVKMGHQPINRKAVISASETDSATITALKNKGILQEIKVEKQFEATLKFSNNLPPLADFQQKAWLELEAAFQKFNVVLLEGVTGSGKTRLYLEWIRHITQKNQQVLLLLPEIALTTQIIIRLQAFFDSEVLVYHSKISERSRMETYYQVQQGTPLVIGTRSALLLPFANLGMIIIDEEHDRSFKQQDPAPRFQARDAAIVLGHQHQAKVLLGSATPSIESWYNVYLEKYGHVQINQRFGQLSLPGLQLIDLRQHKMNQDQREIFMTPVLENEIHQTLDAGKQVIIFQNRRGFAPMVQCTNCGHIEYCDDCDVSMTYHKYANKLQCHYCRKERKFPSQCPKCKHWGMEIQGMGTEKLEEAYKVFFPKVSIDRLDYDTASGKKRLSNILHRFMNKDTQILIGTQMIAKGLDFDHVGLVVIPMADQLLGFPDFRSAEWAFQMLKQVSGRAGRKGSQGKVIIQSYQPEHMVLQHLLKGENLPFFRSELNERKLFQYPPFTRLVRIIFKNKNKEKNLRVSYECYQYFIAYFDNRIQPPTPPLVSYVKNQHILVIYIKLRKQNKEAQLFRNRMSEFVKMIKGRPGYSSFRITVDIDPF